MIHSKLRQTDDWKLCLQVMEVFLEVVAPELILKAWEGFNQQSHLEKGHAKGKDREAEYWCWGFQHEEWIAWLYLKGYSQNHCGWPDRASRRRAEWDQTSKRGNAVSSPVLWEMLLYFSGCLWRLKLNSHFCDNEAFLFILDNFTWDIPFNFNLTLKILIIFQKVGTE